MSYYLDHAATTPLDSEVLNAMIPYLTEYYANPSSLHEQGIFVRRKINDMRERVASSFHVQPSGVIFTSGGTEATNLALMGYAKAHPEKKHILTTTIEHHATSHTIEALETLGYSCDYIPVDHEGFVKIENLKKLITNNTLLVSIIWGNNEIGTIQDVQMIGQIAHDHGAILHVDAVQMAGQADIDLHTLPIDMMTISAHKFYGPKGIGALILNEGITVAPILYGGQHEKGYRSGTENVSGIIGLAKALELAKSRMNGYKKELLTLQNEYRRQLMMRIPEIEFNGPKDETKRLPSILSMSLPHISSHELQYALNRKGVYVSTGSACLSNEIKGSHVLDAIHRDPSYATLRLSFGSKSSFEDISAVVQIIKDVYEELKEN